MASTDLRAAAQQALEAMSSFESGTNGLYEGEFAQEIDALRAALEADDGMYGAKALTKAYEHGWNAAKADGDKLSPGEPGQEPDPWGAGYEAGYAAGMEERQAEPVQKPQRKPLVDPAEYDDFEAAIRHNERVTARRYDSVGPVALETVYETIIHWDEGGGKRSRRELARRIVDIYGAPPQRKPLTDEEIDALELPPSGTATVRDFVRLVERAHGIV